MPTLVLPRSAFIHLPQAGGSWVSAALARAGLQGHQVLLKAHPDSWAPWSHADHIDLAHIDCFKFGFVRHPAAWWRSFWGYRMRTGWVDWHPIDSVCRADEFTRFIERVLEHRPGYLSTLYDRFVGTSDEPIDFVGRCENLADDLLRALDQADEKFDRDALMTTPAENTTDFRQFTAEYSPEQLRAICEAESAAMERFGYEIQLPKSRARSTAPMLTTRTAILNWLADQFGAGSYLEIGLGNGQNFNTVRCPHKVGVDPGGAECSDSCATHRMTSDAFFEQNEESFDLIFIDGLHHAEVVERDVRNALDALNEGGTVVCHDMNPSSEGMQSVPRSQLIWTGDCWRAWLAIRAERDDLQMLVVDTDYGVGIIRPQGEPKTPRLQLPTDEPEYAEFAANRREWMPLVAPSGLPAALGIEAAPPPRFTVPPVPGEGRRFLLYCPTKAGDHLGDYLSEDRLFDVAFNDFSGRGKGTTGAEWRFAKRGHKWPCIASNLPKINRGYEFYAFFDNDIEIDIEDLNRLFLAAEEHDLDLCQAGLTADSHTAHWHLRAQAGSELRDCRFVEIMMPVFSRRALERCIHTFGDSESGWGLDAIWPGYLENCRIAVVDSVQARHARPVESAGWVLDNGMTPFEEMHAVVAKHLAMRSKSHGANPLRSHFESNQEGRLIHKWLHYFDIYHRYFADLRGREITFVEIGVQNGGGLDMWREYFGAKARIIGVDFDPRCAALAGPGTEIHIGDQADPGFLTQLREAIGEIDILLDDGGHTMEQQLTTFEHLYDAVREDGGLYLVEDTHTSYWPEYGGGYREPASFMEHAKGLTDQLNAWHSRDAESLSVDRFTRSTRAIHFYDSMVVFEKQRRGQPHDERRGRPSF